MIKPLTSLRFLFALLVFFSHLPSTSSEEYGMVWLFHQLSSRGGVGVSFFFVLSGFVISYAYYGKLRNKKQIIRFYRNRIARLWPMHLLTFVVSVPLVILNYGLLPKKAGIMNVLLLQSLSTSKPVYFSYNSPSWSISTEFMFYFLSPVIFYLLSQLSKSPKGHTILKLSLVLPLMAILLLYSIGITDNSLYHAVFYISPVSRIADFLLGCLVYLAWNSIGDLASFQRKTRLFSHLDVISVLVFILFYIADAVFNLIPIPIRYSLYYWVPMALVIFSFALPSGKLVEFLKHPILVHLGTISFSFYLIHQLIIRYLFAGIDLMGMQNWAQTHTMSLTLSLFISVIALSHLSEKYIERKLYSYFRLE